MASAKRDFLGSGVLDKAVADPHEKQVSGYDHYLVGVQQPGYFSACAF